jgi:hypothetical protein
MNSQKSQPQIIAFDTPVRIPSEIEVCPICRGPLRVIVLDWEYIDFGVLPAVFFLFRPGGCYSIHCETEQKDGQPTSDHADRLEELGQVIPSITEWLKSHDFSADGERSDGLISRPRITDT